MTTYVDKRLEEVDDEELTQIVADADLPSLLPAIAYALGDASWLDADLRPRLALREGRQVPQGALSEESQARARELAVNGLKRLQSSRDAVRSDREQVVHDCLEFVTSGQSDTYRAALRAELGLSTSDTPAVRLVTPLSVLVVGAGISGIAAAHELIRIGARVTVIERNPDVGGVWLENSYPGCRLDTPNFAYSFSFAPSSRWTHHFSTRDSILAYLRDVASQEGLNSSIEFDTTLTEARWISETTQWSVVTSDKAGHTSQRNFDVVVTAVGQLNQPAIPDLSGLENFEGVYFHSARWDHDVDLAGKRVAVIGTGASSYQYSPEIAARVEKLTIFQRSAPWGLPTPHYHNEIATGQRWLLDNVPEYHRWVRFLQFWMSMEGMRKFAIVDPAWNEDGSVSAASSDLRAQLVTHLTNQFSDRPDLLEHVIPPYPPYAKRMLRDNGVWARMLKRDNVDLVTQKIVEVTPRGIRTADDVVHTVDVIIFGTGFRASHFLPGMQIFGRGNIELHEHWAGEPRAFLGTSVPEFPNFFMLYGPNTNLVLNASAVQFSEFALHHVTACVAELSQRGGGSMEIQKEPFDDYNALIDNHNTLMAWGIPGVSSWYKNASGRVSQNWPLGGLDYWEMTNGVNVSDYAFDPPQGR